MRTGALTGHYRSGSFTFIPATLGQLLMNAPDKEQNYLVSLAIVYYIFASVLALVSLIFAINVLGFLLTLTKLAASGRVADFYVAGLLTGIAGFVAAFIGAIMHLAMGNCLRRRRNYGYCWFMGVLQVLNFPIGTVLGVLTLIVLRNKIIRRTYGTWVAPQKIPKHAPPAPGQQSGGYAGRYSSMPSPGSLGSASPGYQPMTGGSGRPGMSMGQILMIFGLMVGLLLAALSTAAVVILAGKLAPPEDAPATVATDDGSIIAPAPPLVSADGVAVTPSTDGGPRIAPAAVIDSIDTALVQLRTGDDTAQLRSVEYLRRTPVQTSRAREVAQALTRVLNAGGAASRAAGSVLMNWGDATDAPSIAGAMERGVVDKRAGIRFLQRAADPATAETIARLLGDDDPSVAAAAEAALQDFGPEARPALTVLANGGDANLSAQAQRLLAQMDAAADTSGIVTRLQQLRSTDATEARAAALWFSTAEVNPSRQAEVARALEAATGNPDATVRQAAYEAAVKWADETSGPFFLDKLQNDADAASAAMKVLGAIQYAPAAPALVDRLKQPGPGQAEAAETLTALGPDAAQDAVLPLFNHPEESVRRQARTILQGFRTPLETLVEHSLQDIQAAGAADGNVSELQGGKAAEAIIWLRQLELSETQQKAIADAAVPVAGGDHTGAAVQSLQYLIQQRDRRVAAPFARFVANIDNMQQARTFMRSTGKNGELLARGNLTSDDAQVVSAVAVILSDIGGKDSVPALEKAKVKWQKAGKTQLVNAIEAAIRQASKR